MCSKIPVYSCLLGEMFKAVSLGGTGATNIEFRLTFIHSFFLGCLDIGLLDITFYVVHECNLDEYPFRTGRRARRAQASGTLQRRWIRYEVVQLVCYGKEESTKQLKRTSKRTLRLPCSLLIVSSGSHIDEGGFRLEPVQSFSCLCMLG